MAGTYEVVRRTHVDAPPADVYSHLIDFRRWQAWSPWEGLDPEQSRDYSGAESGPGAKYAWKGNRKVGEGSMEIIEAESPSRVVVDLRFLKPFKSTNVTRFDLVPHDGGTELTWTMTGPTTLVTRIMGVFKSMDAMIGPDFERGLAALKGAAEAS
jgi:hypothetical protein